MAHQQDAHPQDTPSHSRHHDPPAPHPADRPAPHPDLLGAVVLHALISAGQRAMTVGQVIVACERDPSSQADREAIELALEGLIADGLACRRDVRVGATRAALRADALSF